VSYTHNRKRKDGTTWKAYRCGGYHRTGGTLCHSFYIPADRFEEAILRGVAERLADRFGGKDTRAHIRRVVSRVRTQAQKRSRTLQAEAQKREEQILRVVDLGIDGGLDAGACNARIQALRAEAADLHDKHRVLDAVTENLETAAAQAEALLRSADDLILTWNLLDPQERRERLRQLVSVVVVEKTGAGGDSNRATIHFRGLLWEPEEARKAARAEIAEKAPGGQNRRLQADSDLEADVSQWTGSPRRTIVRTCWFTRPSHFRRPRRNPLQRPQKARRAALWPFPWRSTSSTC